MTKSRTYRLPEELVAKLQKKAKEEGRSESNMVAELLKDLLNSK